MNSRGPAEIKTPALKYQEGLSMAIIHVRIDERLIHGQVAAVWSNSLGITRIMVVNDEAAADDLQKGILKMATPPGIKLSVLSIASAAERIKEGRYDGDRVFMIFKKPEDCLKLIEAGIKLSEINVGNMAYKEGAKQIKKSVSVTKEDVEVFKKLDSLGVKMTARMIPDEPAGNFMDLIKDMI